jgi:hypothetical protein
VAASATPHATHGAHQGAGGAKFHHAHRAPDFIVRIVSDGTPTSP